MNKMTCSNCGKEKELLFCEHCGSHEPFEGYTHNPSKELIKSVSGELKIDYSFGKETDAKLSDKIKFLETHPVIVNSVTKCLNCPFAYEMQTG